MVVDAIRVKSGGIGIIFSSSPGTHIVGISNPDYGFKSFPRLRGELDIVGGKTCNSPYREAGLPKTGHQISVFSVFRHARCSPIWLQETGILG